MRGEQSTEAEVPTLPDDEPRHSQKRRKTADRGGNGTHAQVQKHVLNTPMKGPALFDRDGHIDLLSDHAQLRQNQSKPAEQTVEPRGMRLADAAEYGAKSGDPWYRSSLSDGSYRQDRISTDVWGNADPRRQEREKQRIDASDPLAAMKKGVKQLRRAEEDRRQWKAQRERDLNEVETLARETAQRRRKNSDADSIEGFDLDDGYTKRRHKHATGSKDTHHRRHRHHRHRSRSRDRQRYRSRSPRKPGD